MNAAQPRAYDVFQWIDKTLGGDWRASFKSWGPIRFWFSGALMTHWDIWWIDCKRRCTG